MARARLWTFSAARLRASASAVRSSCRNETRLTAASTATGNRINTPCQRNDGFRRPGRLAATGIAFRSVIARRLARQQTNTKPSHPNKDQTGKPTGWSLLLALTTGRTKNAVTTTNITRHKV
jgi:hypothetical protein